jgi:hypothetical protein
LLDSRGGDLQVRVVLQGFAHQRLELRVLEHREPAVADRHRRAGLCLPGFRQLEVGQSLLGDILPRGRRADDAASHGRRERERESTPGRAHQCSFSTR